MKIQEITIKNCFGLETLTIQPGALTVVSGRNGSGKTSVLNALKLVLSGGHEPQAIRQGAEEAEIQLTMADGVTITKTITSQKSTLTVKHPKLGRISKSQSWINQVVDSISLDPVAFLNSPPKARVDALLAAIPMRVTADQLRDLPVGELKGIDLDRHALEVLAELGKGIYDSRRDLNAQAREKRATARQMSETLPADPPEGNWRDSLSEATEEFRDLQKTTQQRVAWIKEDCAKAIHVARELNSGRKETARIGMEDEISAIRARYAHDAALLDEERDLAIGEAEHHRDAALKCAEAEYRPKNQELSERIAKAKAMVEAVTKAETTRNLIAKLETDAETIEKRAEVLTNALARMATLKSELLSGVPIQGLEIRDGDIYLNGIAFDHVNDAERHRIALEVARLKAGELGLIVLDRSEIFDSKNWESFRQAAIDSGLQVICALVDDGDLQVRSEVAYVQ
jgi:DNA repair exonuclease SbcCD ATPase subunit